MRKFLEELLDEATITGGYPDNGINGMCTDDDLPPGTTVFGDKMVPIVVPNRLTGATVKYVPADEVGDNWNYDEFEHSQSMGSYKSYSDTLDGLNKLLGDRHWKHTDARKFRMAQDKWIARKGNQDGGGVKQTAKTSDDAPSHMELTKDGETDKIRGDKPLSNDYWREVDMKKLDIMERITDYLGEPEERIDEAVVDKDDRKGLVNAILKGNPVKLKLDSLGGVELNIAGKGNNVKVWYKKNEDLTLTLVDICDSLGYDFEVSKSGTEQTFTITK